MLKSLLVYVCDYQLAMNQVMIVSCVMLWTKIIEHGKKYSKGSIVKKEDSNAPFEKQCFNLTS